MKLLRHFATCFALIASINLSYAQPNAVLNQAYIDQCAPYAYAIYNIFGSTGYNQVTWSYSGSPNLIFGGGGSPNICLEYPTGGTFTLTVTLTNTVTGLTDTETVTYSFGVPPVVSFTTTGSICTGSAIQFTDTSVPGGSPIAGWSWNFGDGNNSTLQNPQHSYSVIDTFYMGLTVFDAFGCANYSTMQLIMPDISSVSDFNMAPLCPCNSVQMNYTGTGVSTSWNFGDNSTAITGSTIHKFDLPGQYLVGLTGTDVNGCSYTRYQAIDICPNDTVWTSRSDENWIFHDKRWINMASGAPVNIAGAQLTTSIYGGAAAMSDPETGQLLFYSEGTKIWNANHVIMPNGNGLLGYNQTSQPVLIVPFPADKNKYYVFTLAGHFSSTDPQTYYYSVVDMTLNGGLGDVVPGQKNIVLTTVDMGGGGFSTSMLTGTTKTPPSACGDDAEYWVVAHTGYNQYSAFLISGSTISAPVVTQIGQGNVYGTAAFSRSGSQMADANHGVNGVEVYNFDLQTGVFSNHRKISGAGYWIGYGTCFSPDESQVYMSNGIASGGNVPKLAQGHPLATYPQDNVVPIFTSNLNFLQCMWPGPDGDIYLARSLSGNIAKLDNPNGYGVASGFILNAHATGGAQGNGLQNIIPLKIHIKDSTFALFDADTTNCLDVAFNNQTILPNYPDLCSFLYNNDTLNFEWDFGDGTNSVQFSPNHTYASEGIYTVTLIVNRPFMCWSDTLVKTIHVGPKPIISAVNFQNLTCALLATTLDATSAGNSLVWNGGLLVNAANPANVNAAGSYTVTATHPVSNCTTDSTITVLINNTPPTITSATNSGDITCVNLNSTLTAVSAGNTLVWNGGVLVNAANPANVNAAGTYTVTATDPINGCTSTATTTVNTNTTAPTITSATNSGDITCVNLNSTLTAVSAGNTLAWNGGALVNAVNPANVNAAGTYTVTATDPINGCTSTATTTVNTNTTAPTITSATNSGDITCVNLNSTLTAVSAGNTLVWNGGALVNAANPATATAAGTYTVTATDPINGCTSTATTTVNTNTTSPTITSATNSGDITCVNLNSTLTAVSAGNTLVWNGGALVNAANPASANAAGTYTVTATDPINGCTSTATTTVNTNTTAPTITSATNSGDITCVNLNSTLTAVSAGNTLVWNGGALVNAANPATANAAGTYTVTATDPINGCTSTATTTVNTNTTAPTITSATNSGDITCVNLNSTLTAVSAGNTLVWNGGALVNAANPATANTAGTYTVTATDPINGCTSNATTTVNTNTTSPTITSAINSGDITCVNLNSTLTAVSAGNTLVWNGGTLVNAANPASANAAGTYTVTATDPINGCTTTATTTVNANTTAPTITSAINNGDITCLNLTSTLTAVSAGNTLVWNGGVLVNAANPATANTAGTYTVTATDPINGCTSTATTTVIANTTPPIITSATNSGDITCVNLNSTLTAVSAGNTLVWNGGALVNAANPATANSAGTYTVTATDPINGCTNTATTTVNTNTTPPVADAGADQNLCEGASATLNATASANSSISWSSGVTDGLPFVPLLGSTIYTLTVTDNVNGCVSTDDVNVTVNSVPLVNFVADQVMGCAPLTVNFSNLTIPSGDNCTWNFGNGITATGCGNTSATYTSSGVYDVTLTVSSGGCSSSLTLTDYITVEQQAEAYFTFNSSTLSMDDTELHFENESMFSDSYIWSFGDGSGNSQLENPTHLFPAEPNTSYTVTLIAINAAGCNDTTTAVISISDELIFYVPNAFTPDGNEINNSFFPVFTSGYDPYDYHLTIFNRWGEIVFESYNAATGWDGTYADQGLVEDGVYIWQIDFKETMSDKRHVQRGHVTVLK